MYGDDRKSNLREGIALSESLSFERGLVLLEQTATIIYGTPRGLLAEDEYERRVELARPVFAVLQTSSDKLLNVVCGIASPVSIGQPSEIDALNFPRRFLNVSSTTVLPTSIRGVTENLLSGTYLLGLMLHLIVWHFPSRAHIERVDIPRLEQTWFVESLLADRQMRPLFTTMEGSSITFFDVFDRGTIEPTIKNGLKIGFWGRAKACSYFRNLFCAGWLLGMQFDLATQHGDS